VENVKNDNNLWGLIDAYEKDQTQENILAVFKHCEKTYTNIYDDTNIEFTGYSGADTN